MPDPTVGTDVYWCNYFVYPLSKKLCFLSPNFVTTLGLLAGGKLAHNIATGGDMQEAIVWMLIVNFLDCLDGGIARRCNKSSKFGAIYDIVSDLIKMILILVAIVMRNKDSDDNQYILYAAIASTFYFAKQAYDEIKYPKREFKGIDRFFHDNTLLLGLISIYVIKRFVK